MDDAAIESLQQVASLEDPWTLEFLKEKASDNVSAVLALGKAARDHPRVRRQVHDALMAILNDSPDDHIRPHVISALADCGSTVDDATYAKIKSFRRDADTNTRNAVDEALKAIDQGRSEEEKVSGTNTIKGS